MVIQERTEYIWRLQGLGTEGRGNCKTWKICMDENFVFKGTHVSYNKRSVMKLLTLNAPEEASYIMGSFEVLLNKLSNS